MPLGVPVSPAPPGSLLSATPTTDSVGGGIVSVAVGAAALVTFAADHGLQTGATITIAGTVTSGSINGPQVVTVPAGSTTTVTVPVAVFTVTTGTGTATVKALQQQVGVPGVAQDGTDASGVTPPTGAVGIRGWLSGIYSKLSAALAVTQSGTWTVATTGADGSQATIGNTADASTATTLVGLLKAIKAFLAGTLTVGGTVTANAGTGTMAVSGGVTASPTKGTLTDRSGSISVGGTAQVAAASNGTRAYLLLQNIDAGETLWYSLTGTAAANGAGSYQLGPGQAFAMESGYVSTQALSVVAATTGHKWTASEG